MSTAQTAMRLQGFIDANARPNCNNCRHMSLRDNPNSSAAWLWCGRGGFTVRAHAVCERHETAVPAQQSTGSAA